MPGISDFIEKASWEKLSNAVWSSDTTIIEMNNRSFVTERGVVANTISEVNRATLETFDSNIQKVVDYVAPSTLVLESLDNIGKEFDEAIKDTFITQMFRVKGTEILCTAFCILVSFLSCSQRNSLYESIQTMKNSMNAVASTGRAVNDLVQTYNATMASSETIAESAKRLFSGEQDPLRAVFGQQTTGQSAIHAAATIQASISAVEQTVQQISKLLKVISGAKVDVPVAVNGRIWDMANAVLFSFQASAIHAADKAISNVTQPVEDKIKEMQPQNCIGNLASIFFNKLTDSIRRFKEWLLLLIAELFTANAGWGITYKTFGLQLKGMLELIAFLDALALITVHFGDLAILCGVTPCDDNPSDIRDRIRAGLPIEPEQNITPATRTNDAVPSIPSDNIQEIAEQLAPIIGVPLNNIYVGGNELRVAQPLVVNAPTMIKDLISDPDIAKALGPGYTIYTSPDNSNATVVYKFERKCGLKES